MTDILIKLLALKKARVIDLLTFSRSSKLSEVKIDTMDHTVDPIFRQFSGLLWGTGEREEAKQHQSNGTKRRWQKRAALKQQQQEAIKLHYHNHHPGDATES